MAISREIGNSSTEVQSLLRMIDIYSYQGQYSLVLESYEQVLAIYKKVDNPTAAISILPKMVELYKQEGNSSRALKLTQEALDIAKVTKSVNKEIAQAIINIAQIYLDYQEYKKVIFYAQEGLQIANKFQNHTFQLQALNLLGKTYNVLDDYDKATFYAHKSLKIAHKQKAFAVIKPGSVNKYQVLIEASSASFSLASAYASKGEYQKANKYAQISKEYQDRTLNPNFSRSRGIRVLHPIREILNEMYNPLVNPDKIITSKLQKQLQTSYDKALGLAKIASAHNSLGNYQKAINYSKKSLPLARASQDFDAEVLALISSGSAYTLLGKYKKAIKQLKQGIALMPAVNNNKLKSLALSFLSSVYASRKEYKQALDSAQKGLVIAQEYAKYSPGGLVFPLFIFSGIHLELGEYDKAINLAQKNLAFTKPNKYDYETITEKKLQIKALALSIKSNAYLAKKEYKTAIKYSQQSLEILNKINIPITESTTLITLGISYAELNNEEKAIDYLEQSLAIIRKQKNGELESAALTILGSIYNKFGNRNKAVAIIQESLYLLNNTEVAKNEFYPYLGLARTYRDLNQTSVAIVYYKETIIRIEKIRRDIRGLPINLQESFLQAIQDVDGVTTADIYRELADLLLSQGRILEAQQVLELLKIQEIRNFSKDTNTRGTTSTITLSPHRTKNYW